MGQPKTERNKRAKMVGRVSQSKREPKNQTNNGLPWKGEVARPPAAWRLQHFGAGSAGNGIGKRARAGWAPRAARSGSNGRTSTPADAHAPSRRSIAWRISDGSLAWVRVALSCQLVEAVPAPTRWGENGGRFSRARQLRALSRAAVSAHTNRAIRALAAHPAKQARGERDAREHVRHSFPGGGWLAGFAQDFRQWRRTARPPYPHLAREIRVVVRGATGAPCAESR